MYDKYLSTTELSILWQNSMNFLFVIKKNKKTLKHKIRILDQNIEVHKVLLTLHCKCLQGITGTLQGNRSAGISNLWGLHV